ncbi:hypothetical protein MKW94_025167, partial [Papaver nudicaule]|nr:hypothetical protein [Papaver nudicaule]
MSQNQNPFQIVFSTYENIAKCIHTRFSSFFPSSSSSTSSTSDGQLMIVQPNTENFTKSVLCLWNLISRQYESVERQDLRQFCNVSKIWTTG